MSILRVFVCAFIVVSLSCALRRNVANGARCCDSRDPLRVRSSKDSVNVFGLFCFFNACPWAPWTHASSMRVAAALSCFQGESADVAAKALLALGFKSLQLTPGCAPSENLPEVIAGIPTTTHHGYTPTAMRHRVWHDGDIVTTSDSIHPPKADDASWLWDYAVDDLPVIEVMYPGYALGTGSEIRRAMEAGMRLAVDVSHLFIQIQSGAATQADVAALLDYDFISEIHVSHNDGRHDLHHPLTDTAYGLAWARERTDTPVVFEGYLHRLTHSERLAQVELLASVVG